MHASASGWQRWASPVALAALPLLVYGRFIALGDELANADVFLAYRPVHAWLAEGLRHGAVPLWNPSLAGGFPLAFSEYGWFSPLNWVPLVLGGGHAGYYLAVACYVALAGLATYGLARRWSASPPAALLAGLIFSQSLFVVGGAPLLNQGAAYWALPALLWTVEACYDGRKIAAPAAAALSGLLLLGSHPQLAVLVSLPVAGYAAWLAVERKQWRPLVPLAVAGAVGAAISAVRYLPTLPLVEASTRASGLSTGASAIGSVSPPALLAGIVLPSLAVPRLLASQWSAYVGPLPLLLAPIGLRAAPRPRAIFLGVLALLGMALAFGSYTPLFWLVQRTPLLTYFREPGRFLLWPVLAVALFAAAGLDRVLRGAARPRRRTTVVAGLCVALLALGMAAASVSLRLVEARLRFSLQMRALAGMRPRDYPVGHYLATADASWNLLLRSVDPLRPETLVPLLALAGAVWWWGWAYCFPRWRAAAAIATTGLPLVLYGQLRLPAIPAAAVAAPPSEVVAWSTAADPPGVSSTPTTPIAADARALAPRVYTWLPLAADNELRLQAQAAGLTADEASYRFLKRALAPNLGVAYDVGQIDGYENLLSREQSLLLAALGSERSPVDSSLSLSPLPIGERRQRFGERWPLALASGVGLVLSSEQFQPLTWPSAVRYQPRLVAGGPDLPPLNGFEIAHPLPRAYVTPEWSTASSAEEALGVLLSRAQSDVALPTVITDPDHTLAAPRGRPSAAVPGAPAAQALPAGRFDAQIVAYEARRVEVETVADREAILVLLDAFAPGWTATVTGAPAPLLHANVAFRAVLVPAGRQRVVFSYTPPHWRLAVATTLVAAVGVVVWLTWASIASAALGHRTAR